MRKTLLTLALVALLAIPASAQFGFMPIDATMLLSNKGVQDELKLSDAQKKDLKTANDAFQEAIRKAREDMDFSGLATARQDQVKAIKKVQDKLDEKQAKRLAQIEFQQVTKGKMKNPRIFANTHIQTALKLTSDQKKTVKTTITELDKDFKELDDEAKGDLQKGFANFKKKAELNNEAYEKITKTLDDDQKKDFDKAGGEKFTLKMDFGGFGKDKKKDKKDDQ
jgi:hypothetical protein